MRKSHTRATLEVNCLRCCFWPCTIALFVHVLHQSSNIDRVCPKASVEYDISRNRITDSRGVMQSGLTCQAPSVRISGGGTGTRPMFTIAFPRKFHNFRRLNIPSDYSDSSNASQLFTDRSSISRNTVLLSNSGGKALRSNVPTPVNTSKRT